jgi:seryl-tRNA synthetase
MLDVFDFIVEKGGNPEQIKESQRRRYAPEEVVDEVIALYEDHRKSKYAPRIHIFRRSYAYIFQQLSTQRPK